MSRASFVSRLSLLGVSAAALPALLACLDHPLKAVEYDAVQVDQEGISISINKDVDILFIVDNSGSMGEEQNNLAENFENLVSVLEADDVRANYRIGITTTDNGNPWCSTGSEAGSLVLSSCRSRLDDFIFEGVTEVDQRAACTDNCIHEEIEIIPTSTSKDPNEEPRKWIESTDGNLNVEGATSVEALKCVGPQGINGCGFESHLESMWKALTRATISNDPSYGFIRDGAILSIVFVTDEVDCSYNDAHSSIFAASGNKAFWSNPDDDSPTSAVCWNAGVKCEGENGGIYDSCAAQDYNEDGEEVSAANAEDDAVLRPVSRYVSIVQELEEKKKALNPDQEVLVAAITGVPTNYPDADIQFVNTSAGSTNPNFVADFGIGPGCVSTVAEAVPPVRLAEFARNFLVGSDDVNLFSVCSTDYGPALNSIADKIRDQIRPACMPECVADIDPTTPELDPSCVLTKRVLLEDGETMDIPVPTCEDDGSLPEGEYTCFVALTEESEMDPQCVEEGWNLEFEVIEETDPDLPPVVSSTIIATCELSQNRRNDCPNLPG